MPGAARWYLLPLHGELPAAEQSKVFAPPPRGQRKVLLCTNIYIPWLYYTYCGFTSYQGGAVH